MKRLRGFTLTELMIALAVIGVLTAVVTPAIMKIKPNKNKMMVKKAYYTTENIVESLINNQLYYPDMTDVCLDSSLETTNVYCAGGFDYTASITDSDGESYGGDTKFAKLFASKLNIQSGSVDSLDDGLTTTDGMTWYLPTWGTSKNSVVTKEIKVDVNGKKNEPNCLQTDTGCDEDNFDSFIIEVTENGKMKIRDEDAKAQEYISINASVSKD